MNCDSKVMHDLKALPVNFPNGEAYVVTHSGSVMSKPIATVIHNVHLVNSFKFNFLSISKLASQTNFLIHFTINECVMQGLSHTSP